MRQKNGMLVGIFSLVICVIIVMGVMTPIVSDWTTGERIENDGAGWLRMSYTSSPSYQSIAADLSGEGVVIYNDSDGTPGGTETLTGTEDTIIYADNNLALWYENDTLFLLGQIDGEPVFVQRNDAISLVRESDGIRVSATDTPTITFPFPTYAYEPNSNGNYAFFTNGTPVEMESGRPNAIVGGGNVGVYAYNNIFRYAGLGLGMETEYDENGKLVNVSWSKITEEENTETPEPLGAPYIRITHEDDADGINPASSSESGGLRAIPTPTYTDGDWGYDLSNVGGVQKAKIVSYSGTGGGPITVPATIGGYDVYMLGKDSTGANVFPTGTNLSATDLIISSGITKIGRNACASASGFTGSLIIPNTVTSIGDNAFSGCSGFTGSLIIPDSVTSIGGNAFSNCSHFTGDLTLSANITSVGNGCFNGAGFSGGTLTVLNGQMYPDCFDNTGFYTAYLSDTVTFQNAGAGCFVGSSIKSIRLPSNLTVIPASSFRQCFNLTEVIIPDTVTSIGANAFSDCSHLTNVKLPSGLISIGNSAFYNAGSSEALPNTINEIVIPDTVTSIGSSAFQYFKAYKLIIASEAIPGNATAFSNSSGSYTLEVLDLSDTVDYSVDRYGLKTNNVVIYDSIGDCFGYISFTEIGSDPAITGPIATLLIAVPLLMVVGLTIAAMTVMRGRVQ